MKELTLKEKMAYETIDRLEQQLADLRLQAGGMQMEIDELREDAARYQFLKAHCGKIDFDGGYTQFYRFPQLNRDNGEKNLPIHRQYFNDIDACVDYHRKKA